MPRRYSMEVRHEEAERRRQRLIEAAIEVMGEVGAERLTMEAVAERADTATRTLYNHFSSRDELISQALGRLLDDLRAALATLGPPTGPPRQRLHRFVETLFDAYGRQGASLTTLLEHRDLPEVDRQITEMRAWRRAQLEAMLKPARADLAMPLGQATAIAFVLTNHATLQGLLESGLSPARALATTLAALDAALFR